MPTTLDFSSIVRVHKIGILRRNVTFLGRVFVGLRVKVDTIAELVGPLFAIDIQESKVDVSHSHFAQNLVVEVVVVITERIVQLGTNELQADETKG